MTTFKQQLINEKKHAIEELRKRFVSKAREKAMERARNGFDDLIIRTDDFNCDYEILFVREESEDTLKALRKSCTGCDVRVMAVPFNGIKFVISWSDEPLEGKQDESI